MPDRWFAPFAIAMLAACSSPEEVAEKTGVSADAGAATAGGEAKATASGTEFAFARTFAEPAGGKLEFSYAWPKQAAVEPNLAALLHDKLDRQLADTKGDWEASYAECPKEAVSCRNYSLEARYEVVADLPGYLSLSNLFSTYTGGAHGIYGMESLVWDRKAGNALDGIDLFRSPAALGSAIGPALCKALNAARVRKGMEPIKEGADSGFEPCPGVDQATVLVGSSNGKTFDRITAWYGPYVAGSYAEGEYELDFPMTAAMLEAVKPAYRPAFSAKR
ncbi:DUF4163 domain-containing protein [Tsuneonella sp. SYSU-LHT278]|uniref:DUF4163 domain-containing protein n=1 Tax=Tsuneonella sediminis TaxID=3416089 RepID=UPI003F78E670